MQSIDHKGLYVKYDLGLFLSTFSSSKTLWEKRKIDNRKICSYLFFLRKIIMKFYLLNIILI
jgi:hypothetical protein